MKEPAKRRESAGIGTRTHDAERFVEREVDEVVVSHDAVAVDVQDDLRGVDACAEGVDHATVAGHSPLRDELLTDAAAAHPGLGEHLLEPYTFRMWRLTLNVRFGHHQAPADRYREEVE